jgi:hypothetical protein
MVGLRLRAATALLALALVASSQGCGTNDGPNGPPFEPGDIAGPKSLLITKSDIEGVGASTPYAAVLRWWQAMQRRDVAGVRRSYAGHVAKSEARHEIHGLQARESQPIEPSVETHGDRATVEITVRAATRFVATPSVVSITDYPASVLLERTAEGWKLRPGSYRHYLKSRKLPRLAGQ